LRNRRAVYGRKDGQGFSLIELLVVIAVVAILAALSFPAASRMIENGRKASCLGNLKQIAAAVRLYANDHDDRFPQVRWDTQGEMITMLGDYVSAKAFVCPSATPQDSGRNWPQWFGAKIDGREFYTDYKLNDNGFLIGRPGAAPGSPEAGRRMSTVPNPSHVVVAIDLDWGPQRHGDGQNVAFLDGHTKWMRAEEYTWGARDPWGNFNWYNWGDPNGRGWQR
jgi:prepilin-type N-terminal cleavage/methylation domain-containing protein/prepilin-type processing-associated H-X9-DG protein